MAYYSHTDLLNLGFKTIGENVLISDKASIYNPKNISLGSNIRVDDFCIISAGEGGINIGNHVHIACYVSLIGSASITIKNHVGISSRTAVYSSSDDYSGGYLTGPTIPETFKKVDNRPVIFENHTIVGAGSVILPGVTLHEGAAIGALSLVTRSVNPWGIYVGSPLRFVKERNKTAVELYNQLINNNNA